MAVRRGRGEVAELVADLGKVPPSLSKVLRPKLKQAAEPIKRNAQSRASWSTRIPGAIRIKTSLAGRNAGIALRVDAAKAPHGRAYENLGDRGTFRHPVFGNRSVWVEQQARPYLFPAVQKGRPEVVKAAGEAVDVVSRLHGFR